MRIASASSRKCALISPPRSIAVCPPPAHIFLSQSSSPSSVGVLRECVTEGSSTDDASRARLESLAARFESTIYQTSKSNEDYFHTIANKMYNLKRKKAVPRPDTAASPAVPTVAAQPPLPAPVVAAPQAATTKPLEPAAPRHGVVGQPRMSPQSPSFFLRV